MKNYLFLISFFFINISNTNAFQPPVRDSIIDDFEQASLPVGNDGDGLAIGFLTFTGPGTSSKIELTDSPASQVPGATASNKVISDTLSIPPGGFAGFVHNFSNEAVDTWVPMDWSSYEGIRMWIYGNNTGGTLFLDILDNRNPNSSSDDAERWSLVIPDNFDGWAYFEFEWVDFSRKEIGNGAPNDGFNLDQVHGYAFGGFGSVDMGTNTYYLDSVAIWGTRVIPILVQFATNEYEVDEGDTAQIEVVLDKISDDPVTIMYATAESTAIPDRDFIPVSGTLTIPAGSESITFEVPTIDNNKVDGDRSLIINIFDADGAEIGLYHKTRLTILDNDRPEPALIDDFEGFHPFQSKGNVSAAAIEINDNDPLAVPCQGAYEYVVSTSGDGSLCRTFVEPLDWREATGISFWYYGQGSGETITFKVNDNRSETTANTPPGDWVLAWSDEFNDEAGTPPNKNIWSFELGDGRLNGLRGWGNEELQFYTDDPANAATDGSGNMVIRIQELDPLTTDLICWYGPCEYTSARLNTKDKIAFEYGRIETRVLVPDGEDGLWPAFWALGTDIDEVGWPSTGEIDIMEYVSRLPNEIFGTIHGPGYSGGSSFGEIYDFGEATSNNYHTFAIEWGPDEIEWYVDGTMFHSADPADVPGPWVFNHPFFLLLNMAIGGNFGGPVSESLTFPQELKIDYVRVYQAPETAECFETSFVDDKSGWQLIYLPFEDFVRSGVQPPGAPNDGFGLSEVWGYNITLPVGASSEGNVLFDQIRVTDGVPERPCPLVSIPTLGVWGLILMMLLMLIAGTIGSRRKIFSLD